MSRFQSFFFAAIIVGMCFAGVVSAQSVGNVSIVSGSGQLTCPNCSNTIGKWQYFDALVVKVTDAAGNPIADAPVDWAALAGGVLNESQTRTDASGLARNLFASGGTSASGYVQTTVTATSGGHTATFVETAVAATPLINTPATATLLEPAVGTTFSGVAGAQGTDVIKIRVATFFSGIPNVSVRLVDNQGASSAASCVTAPGADPGSTLTDATGVATCQLVYGPNVGADQPIIALVGGVNKFIGGIFNGVQINSGLTAGLPAGFNAFGYFYATVTASTPGAIAVVSGNSQTANQGAALANPLVAQVTDASGASGIAGQSVTWTVSPAGAATLGNTTTTSDASGNVSNTVTFTSGAPATVQITAALTSNPSISTTFTATANVVTVVTSMQKISGDQQTAVVGAAFALPLVVQLNGPSAPVPNYPVRFAVASGPGTVSATSVNTGANGRAQVTVTAGSTTGTVTVTATAGQATQTFSLTVAPAGPQVTASSFNNGAQAYTSYDANHTALSPCGIGMFGNGPMPQGLSAIRLGPAPTTLSGVRITFNDIAAPILSVNGLSTVDQVFFQVPCDVPAGNNVPVKVTVNGGTGNTNVIVRAAGPGIFESNALSSDGQTRAVLVKADGTFVSDSNPARKGDVVRMFATGLGATIPAVSGTNALPPVGVDALVTGQVIVGVNNAGARLVQARLSPDLVGVYEVDFQVPTDAPAGSNVVLSLAINATGLSATQFSAGSRIAIQ